MRGGVDYDKGIYMEADELDLNVGEIYISTDPYVLYKGDTEQIDVIASNGGVVTLEFVKGIYIGHQYS